MKTISETTYPAADVWAAAVAAQRINKKYISRNTYSTDPSNYDIMRKLLRFELSNCITDDDRVQAVIIREFFQNLMFGYLQGSLAEFMTAAFHASTVENISVGIRGAMPIIASLPSTWENEQKKIANRAIIDALEAASTPWGKVGQVLPDNFDVKIVTCVYSKKYGTWAVNAVQDNHLFFFWSNEAIEVGKIVRLAGKVKKHYKGQTTQLAIFGKEIQNAAD